ncbi:PQQ-binding-like beta-propeller repeat protein [Gimesia aquarii]|uniref:Arylsulfotransferase (ASST) n=1 Tax=Gimesia aquarii TaxID=2527964 RepID=A0A517WN71_9PLAN|nr:PQQ-binding-like beta-propeller repeat protein [Gimesia aquarii]QDU06704.1 Arylsulfotransferase (ASST) [Gimesia aquarii]
MKRFTCFAMILTCLLVNASAYAERLVLVSASYGKNIIAICDQQGNVIWSHKTAGPSKGHAGHHDIHLLPNGNILYHDSWTTTTEMTLDKQVVWSYDSATMNGNKGKRVDVHAFARLPNGHTMITESGVGRIIEVDQNGKIEHQFPLKKGGTQSTRLVRITPQGNYLVCSEQPGVVTEYNRKGEVVWDYLIKTRVYGAIRLKNGNTLIASGSGNSVVEVSPEKKVVWEIRGRVPKTDVQLKWTTCLQELDNGNLIIGNCHAGPDNPQIIELDRNRKIVWKFDEYDLVGNGLACWQVLDDSQSDLVRKKLSVLTP